jgi:hypothetical protein
MEFRGVKICNEILMKLQKITENLLSFKLMERYGTLEGGRERGRQGGLWVQ